MRALILSCRIGGGHDACARAISDELSARGDECVTRDAMWFVAKGLPPILSNIHVWVYRHTPSVFGKVYRYGEKHPASFRPGTLFRRMFRPGTRKLRSYILENGFDTVICTHIFPAMMITDITESLPENAPKIHTCFVATDYTCYPGTAETNLDRYFIPDGSLTGEYVLGEITPDRILPSGIPVRPSFYRRIPTSTAKERSGLPADCRHLVMMCGSMGGGPMQELTLSLAERLQGKELLTVVCGTNKRLYRKLSKACKDNPHIRILSFVKDVATLLDSADLYLTKPGGISVTESAEKHLPMILVDMVAGCEDYNLHFFTELGSAISAKSAKDLCTLCIDTLRSPETLAKMANAYDGRNAENGAVYICDCMEELQPSYAELDGSDFRSSAPYRQEFSTV